MTTAIKVQLVGIPSHMLVNDVIDSHVMIQHNTAIDVLGCDIAAKDKNGVPTLFKALTPELARRIRNEVNERFPVGRNIPDVIVSNGEKPQPQQLDETDWNGMGSFSYAQKVARGMVS